MEQIVDSQVYSSKLLAVNCTTLAVEEGIADNIRHCIKKSISQPMSDFFRNYCKSYPNNDQMS